MENDIKTIELTAEEHRDFLALIQSEIYEWECHHTGADTEYSKGMRALFVKFSDV
tara:strand:- start:289 stop:453 length:165 start_codon:yes stop_codon:yes gene_type:complete